MIRKIPFETIETERLILRKLTGEMWEDILLNGSEEEILLYLGTRSDAIESEKEKARKGFGSFNKSLLIFHLMDKNTGELLGWCGYHTWYRPHDRAEIGYGMYDDAHKSKGYMTEALRAVLKYGFEQMNLHRVEAFIADYNIPSKRLLERCGFRREGVAREHYFDNNQYEDSAFYGLLKHEFNFDR